VTKSRKRRWFWHITPMRKKRNPCMVFVGKTDGWRALGRPKIKLEGNIKTWHKERVWKRVGWSYLPLMETSGASL
jgi:hypothetical protein